MYLTIERTIDNGESLEGDMGEIYKANISSLNWHHITTRSKFDPADIDIAGRTMLFMNRMSVKLGADGFLWDGGIRKKTIAMYTYDYLGSEGYFSGYSYYLTRVRKSLRGVFEIKVNPFVSILDQTRYYERCNLGFKFETGRIAYFNFGEQEKTIYSFDTTFTWLFDFYKDRKSSFYITWAKPLEKIPDYQDKLDSRIYFGFML